MKRLAQSVILLSASAGAIAEPIFHPAGENLGFGPIANHQSLISHTNNPATGASSMDVEASGFGIGLVPSLGIGFEIGAVGNMAANLEDLEEQITAFEDNPSQDRANQIKADFDGFLLDAGENGYLQLHIGVNPIAPIVWNSKDVLGGSLVFDVNAAVQAQLSVLDSPIEYNPLATDPADALQTNTALYIKAGAVAETSLGFSKQLFSNRSGALSAGVRGKMYQVTLKKKLAGLSQFSEVNSLVKDEAEVETTGQTGFGVDLGVIWAAQNYRVGATLRNANAPSFEYDELGVDCASKVGTDQDSCNIAVSYSHEIDMKETWTMDPQVNVELAAYNSSRNWFVAMSADASPVNDAVGNELQWFTASLGYAGRWKIPAGFRLGYRKNLAGSQLSAATLGLSLLKVIHLDVAYGLESIEVKDSETDETQEVPRMAQVNLGIDILF